MPPDQAELKMRHFAQTVMPVLQRDAAFAGPAAAAERTRKPHEDVFAPA